MGAAIAGALCAALVAACETEAASGPPNDDAGAVVDDEGGATDEVVDGGVFMSHADAGCPVKYAGPRAGTIAESVPRAGGPTIAWSEAEGALTVDGRFARATLGDGEQTQLLRVTGYGFDVPSWAKIKGVVVQLKRQGGPLVVDGNIELWLDGKPSSRPKYMSTAWPSAVGTHHYGQEVDTWGDDLTPEMVSRLGFGTEIWAKHKPDAGTGPGTAEVESLIMTVWYCD